MKFCHQESRFPKNHFFFYVVDSKVKNPYRNLSIFLKKFALNPALFRIRIFMTLLIDNWFIENFEVVTLSIDYGTYRMMILIVRRAVSFIFYTPFLENFTVQIADNLYDFWAKLLFVRHRSDITFFRENPEQSSFMLLNVMTD